MAFGTITVTESTFGSISGTVVGAIPGTLSGSVGVPGPQGPTGPQGPAGQGVPAGGTAGQFLTKIDGTNYNTDWTTLDVSDKRDLTDYDFTNVGDEKLKTFGLTLEPPVGSTAIYDSELSVDNLVFKKDTSIGGTEAGQQIEMYYSTSVHFNGEVGLGTRIKSWEDVDGTITDTDGFGFTVDGVDGFKFTKWNGDPFASTMQYRRTSILFPNGSVQSIAFPGFANAALTGNPTAPTAALGDNDTSIATTAFVQQELASGTAVAKNLEVQVRNQSGSTMAAGTIVYISGATGNLPLITKAQANNDANSAQTIGFVKTSIANNGTGYVIVRGELENIDTSALSEGVQLYLSPSTAGTWTTTKPSAPEHLVYVGVVIRSHPTLGTILVSVQNGYELHELHDVALSSEANNDLLVYELSTDLWKNKSFSTLGLATLASPAFTGTPTAPTAAAATNTTQIATTAFVQQEVPAASTTAAGKVELATNAEAQNGSSTTLGMTASTVQYAKSAPNYIRLTAMSASFTTSGTGSFGAVLNSGWNTRAPTSVAGYAIATFFQQFHSRGANPNITTPLPWNKRFVAQFRFAPRTLGTDSNTVNRVCFGKGSGNVGGDLTLRGIEVRQVASNALELLVHDGTTLTTVTTSTTVSTSTSVDLRIVSDGAGNVTLFSDDVQIATTSAGPSTVGSTFNCNYSIESQNLATITGTANTLYVAEMSFEFAN